MATSAQPATTEAGKPRPPAPVFDPAIHRLTQWEGFTAVVVHRSQLNEAKYNPRVMRDTARGRLKDGIEAVKLVAPLTWNKRTETLVGGHQRLRALDALEHTRDYWLTVAQIDVDEDTEVEINILLNNPEAAGDWDMDKLHALIVGREKPIRLEATGFGADDMYTMFGQAAFHGDEGAQQLDKLADDLREKREAYDRVVNTAKASREAVSDHNAGEDYYGILVFRNGNDRDEFLAELNLALDARHWYLDGRDLRRIFRILDQKAKAEGEPLQPGDVVRAYNGRQMTVESVSTRQVAHCVWKDEDESGEVEVEGEYFSHMLTKEAAADEAAE